MRGRLPISANAAVVKWVWRSMEKSGENGLQRLCEWKKMNARKKYFMENAESFRLRFVKYLHCAVTVGLFFVFWLIFRYPNGDLHVTKAFRYDIFTTIGYAILLIWFNKTFDSYTLGYFRIRSLAFSQFLAEIFSTVFIYFTVSVAWFKLNNPIIFLPMLLIQAIWDCLWSYYANGLYYRLVKKYRTVVIYRNRADLVRFGDISGKPIDRLFNIEKYIQYNGTDFFEIKAALAPYDALFAAGVNPTLMNALCKYCVEANVHGFFLPHIGDVIMSGAEHIKSFTTPVLSVRRAVKPFEYMLVKRLFDLLVSGLGLVILSPLMLLTAILIKAYDGGPVFYKQVRLTKDGKKFKIIKFRSMRMDAEKDGVACLSTGEDDPRITPVGRYIRACRLDELPQLINILRGDMSLVGPRPERPEIAAEYEKFLPEFNLRLQVKAGLTGYAQVYGKYNTYPYEKLEFDLLYINQMNVLTDLELMFNTFRILFSRESTEGVENLTAWMDTEEYEKEMETVRNS